MVWRIEPVYGNDIGRYIDAIAKIRMKVFRDWPYLYDGDLAYEREYLANYTRSRRSLCLLITHNSRLCGISTAIPLIDEHDDLKQPMIDSGYEPDSIFYYGETCLLPEARGKGMYRSIFEAREEHVKSFSDDYRHVCFCSVVRPDNHPSKPSGHRALDPIWRSYGYQKLGVHMRFSWQDVGNGKNTAKNLAVWIKRIYENKK